jgi:hypothetical protein
MVCLLAGAWSLIAAQDQLAPEQLYKAIRTRYEEATGSAQLFVNGSLYQDVYPGTSGHPFLGSGQWSEGTIHAGGRAYGGILLRYDLCKDLLIYNHIHEKGIYAVSLNRETIDRFSLQGHHFIHYRENSREREEHLPKHNDPGFYEEICRGKASLYLKRVKRFNPPTAGGSGSFNAFETIHILKDGILQRISGKRSLLRVLEDQEIQIRRFIKEHKMILRGNDVAAYRQVVEYYNSIQP